MKILNEIYNDEEFKWELFDFYFKNLKIGVFDIESTGLSPKKNHLILSGFILPQGNGTFLSKQIFAESLDDEMQVIEETLNISSQLDLIITYNGISFDIPFLTKRMEHHGIRNKYIPYDLDLYKIVKGHSDIKRFVPNLKQTTMENYMGLWDKRQDKIDGGISIDLYSQYLQTKDIDLERQILLHNSDDVKQLYRLLNVIKQTNFHKAMCTMGFPYNEFIVEKIKLSTKKLAFSGRKIGRSLYYQAYDDEAQYKANFNGNTFNVEVSLIKEDVLTFLDLNNYHISLDDFTNCGQLYGHYLVLAIEKEANHLAITTFVKKLLQLITQTIFSSKEE